MSLATSPRYIVVRNPRPRILPQWLRARLGECYLAVEIQTLWVTHPDQARRFAFLGAAQSYITKTDGTRWNGMENAIVRRHGMGVRPE